MIGCRYAHFWQGRWRRAECGGWGRGLKLNAGVVFTRQEGESTTEMTLEAFSKAWPSTNPSTATSISFEKATIILGLPAIFR